MDISVIFVVGASYSGIFRCGTEDKALGMAAVVFGHLPLAINRRLYGARLQQLLAAVIVRALSWLSGILLNAYEVFNSNLYIAVIFSIVSMLIPSLLVVPGVLQTMEVIGVIMISGAIITYGIVQYLS